MISVKQYVRVSNLENHGYSYSLVSYFDDVTPWFYLHDLAHVQKVLISFSFEDRENKKLVIPLGFFYHDGFLAKRL